MALAFTYSTQIYRAISAEKKYGTLIPSGLSPKTCVKFKRGQLLVENTPLYTPPPRLGDTQLESRGGSQGEKKRLGLQRCYNTDAAGG